jgi:chromosome segregation ATPase
VTIRAMVSLFAVSLASVSFVACGNPGGLSEDQADEIQAARDEAREAKESVADLNETIAGLERRLERATGGSERRSRLLDKRLDGISDRLNERVAGLRAAIEDAKSASASAASDAAAAAVAAGRVGDIAQDLNVLRTRYDVHLRRFHGGGG